MTAQEFQFGVDKYNQGRADEKAAAEEAKLVERAAALASIGDFSLYKYLGYTDDEIAKISAAWQTANAPKGGGTYTPVSNTPTMTLSTAKALASEGFIDADVAAVLMQNGYSANALEYLYGYKANAPVNSGSAPALSTEAQNVANAIKNGNDIVTANMLDYYRKSNRITDEELEYLLSLAGV